MHVPRYCFSLLFFLCLALPVFAVSPAQVWVNAAWHGRGACGGHHWNVDAFTSIQRGIDEVASGGNVRVAPGVYAERVVISKPVTLTGPLAGITPNAPSMADPYAANPARATGAEAIILPPTTNLTLDAGMLLTIRAEQVTIDGFTLDGHNPALTQGVALNGVEGHAAAGIGEVNGPLRQAVIVNNIVRNMYLAGIYITVQGLNSYGNRICANRIDNLPVRTDSLPYATDKAVTAYGIRVGGDSFMGEISDNTLTRCAVGIHVSNLSAQLAEGDGYAPSPVVQRNRVGAYYTGIIVNLVFGHFYPGAIVLLSDNDVAILPADIPTHPDRYGLCLLGIHASCRVLAVGNRLSGGEAGVFIWSAETMTPTPSIEIARGTIADAKYGVWITNHCVFGPGDEGGAALVRGVFIRRCGAGVFLDDDPRGTHAVSACLANGVRIFDGERGMLVHGGRAHLQLQPGWCAVQLSGQQGDYVTLEGNGQTFPGPLDISAVLFGGGAEYHQGKRRAQMTPEELTALAQKLTDARVDPRLGRIE